MRNFTLSYLFALSAVLGTVDAFASASTLASRVSLNQHESRVMPAALTIPARNVSDIRGQSSTQLTALPVANALGCISKIRGGAAAAAKGASESLFSTSTPSGLFNLGLLGLALSTTVIRTGARVGDSARKGDEAKSKAEKPAAIRSLQIKFLSVFWLLRCADWLQGPYFYAVYASKVFGGVPASLGLISKLFLTGFASTALFGPLVGRLSDQYGRKIGTLAFTLIYSLGAASTKSPLLSILLMGRVLSGIGTSLLFSAPEAWLVGEAQAKEKGLDYLGETFGLVSRFGWDTASKRYSLFICCACTKTQMHLSNRFHLLCVPISICDRLTLEILSSPSSPDSSQAQQPPAGDPPVPSSYQLDSSLLAASSPLCFGRRTRPRHHRRAIRNSPLSGMLLRSSKMTQRSCSWGPFRASSRPPCTSSCCNGLRPSAQPSAVHLDQERPPHTGLSSPASWRPASLVRPSSGSSARWASQPKPPRARCWAWDRSPWAPRRTPRQRAPQPPSPWRQSSQPSSPSKPAWACTSPASAPSAVSMCQILTGPLS